MGAFDGSLGPLLMGVFLNAYLYGVLGFQYAVYLNTKYKDPFWIKGTAIFLFIIDTYQSIASLYTVWYYAITNFVNPDIMNTAVWTYGAIPITTAFSGIIVHIFLGHRAFRLTKNMVLYIVIIVLSFATFALALVSGIWGVTHGVSMLQSLNRPPIFGPLVSSWLAAQTAVDILTAVCLAYYLYHGRAPFRMHDTPLPRHFRGALQTGIIASAVSLISFIGFVTQPSINLYAMFALPIGRVYSNALMDTLLSRDPPLPSSGQAEVATKKSLASMWVPTPRPAPASSFSLHSIHVKTETFTDGEGNADDGESGMETKSAHEAFGSTPSDRV